MSPFDYIHELEEIIVRQVLKIEVLEKENEELKKKLRFYENPNTPPSQKSLKKKNRKKANKNRGAPKGHKGATRKKPEPEEVISMNIDTCPDCGHELGDPVRIESRIIEDMPPPQKIKVTKFDMAEYVCPHCGKKVKSKHEDCPQIGNFGIYLLIYITMLKYHLRGPLRKIKDYLLYAHDFEISTKGVHDVLLRVGDVCRDSYNDTVQKVRNAEWVHIDETGIKINGEKHWLWIFRSSEDDVLVVIRKSRGGDVVREILGDDFEGPAIVDGWRAYNWIEIIQRCWAHLLREVDDYKDSSDNGKHLSGEIHSMFTKLKEVLDKGPPMVEREQQKAVFEAEMKDLVRRYQNLEELHGPITYIKNGLGSWYTCLLYPGMEPTNNLGEQAMREHVIMRKIIGCFRSNNGAENYQYIASLLAGWKLQDKNIFEELEQLLRRELCLS